MPELPELLRTATLLDRLRAGDPEAAQVLLQAYQPRLESFVRGRLPASHWVLAETRDAVQEVWLRAMSSIEGFEHRGVGSFWGWLRTIARHYVRDTYRRVSVRPEVRSLDDTGTERAAPSASPHDEVLSREQAECFEQAVDELSEPTRTALLLRLELGLSFRDIALECGFASEDAARMAVTRGTRRVARRMASLA